MIFQDLENMVFHAVNIAAQKEDRFCCSCSEYFEDSDRFCVKCGYKRKSLDESTGGTKKSKSLNDYVKEKVNQRGDFFKGKFQLSKNNSKVLKEIHKFPHLRSEVLINAGLIESNEKGSVAIKRGSRLATKVLKSFGPTEVAPAAVRKHADNDQFLCGSDDYVLSYPTRRLNSLYQAVNTNSQLHFIKKN